MKKLILDEFQSHSWLQESAQFDNSGEALRVQLSPSVGELDDLKNWHRVKDFFRELARPKNRVDVVFPEASSNSMTGICQELAAQGMVLLSIDQESTDQVVHWVARFHLGDRTQSDVTPLILRRCRDDRSWPLLIQNQYVLGRSRESSIVLESMHASSQHCSIRFRRRAVGLVDLQSAAGSYLDNRRVKRAVVDDYGLICLGRKETGHYLEMELRVPSGGAAYLHIISGENAGRVIPLLKPIVVLGRDQSCDQRILAPYISRAHLRFSLFEDCFLIEDHASANGTRINDRPIATDRIVPGDVLEAAGESFDVLGPTMGAGVITNTRLRIGHAEYPLKNTITTIGSHETCDISLPESGLSRLQARLVWEKDGRSLRLYDLGGVALTKVNGVRVGDTVIASGDYIHFGDMETQLLGSVESGSKSEGGKK
ncbi:MAG: FHA domain-containing protein [Planctomycetota bacterium]|nr:FHA domain-containing protein [Planctomycetota bacterium]